MGLKDIFKTAGENISETAEEAVEDLAETVEESGEALAETAIEAVDPLPAILKDPSDIPATINLGDDFNFRTAATKFLESTVAIYTSQAQEAIRSLQEIGKDAVTEGTAYLQKMTEISNLVAQGRISPESAQYALGHYAEALKLIGHRLKNAAKVEAYKRAQAALATTKGVLFSALQVALQIGQPAAASFIRNISPPTA